MKRAMDMTSDRLFSKILAFSLPLLLTNLLQLCYNMADMVIVGRFSSVDGTVGAIGSTTSFLNLVFNFIFGIAAGATVVVAQAIGAQDKDAARDGVHTSLIMAVVLGVFALGIGELVCVPVLKAMNTVYLDMAVTYCRICFLGMPFMAVFNCAFGVMRAQGDTTRPLVILACSGFLNVVLNIVFVAGFGMDVDGVALATLTANILSAVAAMVCLARDTGICGFRFAHLRLHRGALKRVLAIGMPSGFQGVLFSASNLVVQSAVNSFGPATITATAIMANLEAFGYTAGNSVATASLTFAGQNIGAKNYRRILTVMSNSFAVGVVLSGLIGVVIYAFQQPLAGLYMNEMTTHREEVLRVLRIAMNCRVLFLPLCALMECSSFTLRGMGRSTLSMINSLVGAGGLRVVWILTLFAAFPTQGVLFASYPVTWGVTALVQFVCVRVTCRKLLEKQEKVTV